jgi:hypothetical protein
VRGALPLVMLFACSTPERADVPPDGAPTDPDAYSGDSEIRPVTGVLVRADGVRWTYGLEACSLDFGCFYSDQTVLWWEQAIGATWIIDHSRAGAMSIVGDDQDVFIVTGPSHDERYVKSLSRGALSIPRPWTQGPAIDDTYVYWAERSLDNGGYSLRRATRVGDGSDAETIASMFSNVTQLAVYADYVWGFDLSGSLFRAPANGGSIETMSTKVLAMAVAPSGLIISRGTTGNSELGSFDATGTYRVLTPLEPAALYIRADDRDVFWTSASPPDYEERTIHRMPIGGGPIATVATGMKHREAFGITADQVLFDFTPDGFKTAPR